MINLLKLIIQHCSSPLHYRGLYWFSTHCLAICSAHSQCWFTLTALSIVFRQSRQLFSAKTNLKPLCTLVLKTNEKKHTVNDSVHIMKHLAASETSIFLFLWWRTRKDKEGIGLTITHWTKKQTKYIIMLFHHCWISQYRTVFHHINWKGVMSIFLLPQVTKIVLLRF